MSLGQVVEAALRRDLALPAPAQLRPEVPVFTAGGGAQPGLDLTSNRAMIEALDEDVALDERR